MKTVLLLTARYPFLPGEQFIEGEIPYWAAHDELRIVVLPMYAEGNARSMPKGVEVDLSLAEALTRGRQVSGLIPAVLSPLFWLEVRDLFGRRSTDVESYMRALLSASRIHCLSRALRKVCARYQGEKIAYCYWNDLQSYAAVLAKRRSTVDRVFARAHRFDLYEEVRPHGYMPFKRQFINDFDAIFSVSEDGCAYIHNKYGVAEEKVAVRRLGVPVPDTSAQVGSADDYHVISISSCIPVKRIDRIIDALSEVGEQKPTRTIRWTHIGEGPLRSALTERASSKLLPAGVQFQFLGELGNAEVHRYLSESPVDLFINTSESEGVPVSIMEAMSYGVPVVAPRVGGVPEIVNDTVGCLLSSTPTTHEIAEAIIRTEGRLADLRRNARALVVEFYNSATNYPRLIAEMTA